MNLTANDESSFKDKLLSNKMNTARNSSDQNPATLVHVEDSNARASSSLAKRKLNTSRHLNYILSILCVILVCCLLIVILNNLRCLTALNCLKSSSSNESTVDTAAKETSSLSNKLTNKTAGKHDHKTDLIELKESFNSKWNSSRLPSSLKPYHYVISLKIDVYNKYFAGNCTIFFKCEEKTALLVVHSDSNLIFESAAYLPTVHETDPVNLNVTTRRLGVKSMETNLFFNYLIIELNSNEMFKKTHHYCVTFENFSSEITNNLKGLYFSSYNTNNGTVK